MPSPTSQPQPQPQGCLLVAVALDQFESAVAFAVARAHRESRPVHLIHVLQVTSAEAYTEAWGESADLHLTRATEALAEATTLARGLAQGRVTVTSELVDHGLVVPVLVHRSLDARAVVLQHRRLNRVQRVLTGSVVHGVAARSDGPIVSVPEGWQDDGERQRTVVVAVQDPDEAGALLTAALGEIGNAPTRLLLAHAWWLGSDYDALLDPDTVELHRRSGEDSLSLLTTSVRESAPELDVESLVVHAPAAAALLRLLGAGDLVVVGRRHHRMAPAGHLGPVTCALLEKSPAPVLVAGEHDLRRGGHTSTRTRIAAALGRTTGHRPDRTTV